MRTGTYGTYGIYGTDGTDGTDGRDGTCGAYGMRILDTDADAHTDTGQMIQIQALTQGTDGIDMTHGAYGTYGAWVSIFSHCADLNV